MNNLTFGMALAALREGKKVKRAHWPFDQYFREITFNGFEPSLVEYANDVDTGAHTGYPGATIMYCDLIADDWEVTSGLVN